MDHDTSNMDQRSTVAPGPTRRRPRRNQPAPPVWGTEVPTLAVLAAPHGFRVYRDVCGDENLPGRFGEIFRHGPDCLAVQFGGVRANGRRFRDPRKVWWRRQQAKRMPRLHLIVDGEDEAVFHFPDALLATVAELIGAYHAYGAARRSGTLPAAA